jgi:two-component system NtrC family sensor kinase
MHAESTPRSLPRRILIVEDKAIVSGFLVDLLSDAGYRVDIAPDGRAALDKVEAATYDVILSDVDMPGLDGPRLYEELTRRHPHLRGRFVLLAGNIERETVRAFIERTAVPCLAKPFNIETVLRAIRGLAG